MNKNHNSTESQCMFSKLCEKPQRKLCVSFYTAWQSMAYHGNQQWAVGSQIMQQNLHNLKSQGFLQKGGGGVWSLNGLCLYFGRFLKEGKKCSCVLGFLLFIIKVTFVSDRAAATRPDDTLNCSFTLDGQAKRQLWGIFYNTFHNRNKIINHTGRATIDMGNPLVLHTNSSDEFRQTAHLLLTPTYIQLIDTGFLLTELKQESIVLQASTAYPANCKMPYL